MRASRIQAIVLRQLFLMRGSMSRVLPIVVWVAVDMLVWGFMTRWLDRLAPGFDFVPVVLGAVLLWDFFARVMHGVALAFFEDVWSRNFLNLFASPLTIREYVTGLVLTSIGTSALGLVVMILLAGAFGLSFFAYGVVLLPFLLVLFLFGIALGIVGCAVVLRLGPASEWFIWPVPALISPFVGVFYPLSTLPEWMQRFAKVLPPSYVFESMRSVVAGGPASGIGLACGAALAFVDLLLACWYFTHVYRRAVRTGLIARYSAESVN